MVNTVGNMLLVIAHPADIPDRDGADWVLEAAMKKSSRQRHIWADGGYSGELVARYLRRLAPNAMTTARYHITGAA